MGKKSQFKRSKKKELIKERQEIIRQIVTLKNPWLSFWKRIDFWIYSVCFLLILAFPFIKPDALAFGDQAVIHTSKGDIEVNLYPKDAPKTVENFTGLSAKGYYDNLTFHRVIKEFMIQGGDPTGTGTGGESIWGGTFNDEINAESLGLTADQIKTFTDKGYTYNNSLQSHKMEVGALAMANSGPDTNGSQFFIITEKDQLYLDGQHTVFGKVKKGLDIAKAISEVPTDENDKPKDPVIIYSIEVK